MRLIDRFFRRHPSQQTRTSTSLCSFLPLWVRYPLKGQRRAAVERWKQHQLEQLMEIDTSPATTKSGRVITLVAVLPGRTLDLAEFLKPWLRSVELVGLRGTLLHAGPCDLTSVRNQYPTIDLVPAHIGTRHLFLERHFAVRDYLKQISDEFVLITDGRDVAFRRDPFEVLQGHAPQLALGTEGIPIRENKHVLKKMQAAYQQPHYPDRLAFNPGIVGGSRERVIDLLEFLTHEIDTLDCQSIDCDMGVFNKVVHDHYALDDIFTGETLHSRFGYWEFNTPAPIIHK